MNWIENVINRSNIVQANSLYEQQLINKLIDVSYNLADEHNRGTILASFYDLAIAAVYYTYITNSGWMYCKNVLLECYLY